MVNGQRLMMNGVKRRHSYGWCWLLVGVLWLSGCTSLIPSETPAGTVPAGTVPPPTATVVSGGAAVYDNPIFPGDFPDPFVLPVGDNYYAYSTNVGDVNVPVVRFSADFATYEALGDALPALPLWAAWHQGLTWAPAVLAQGERYILYYTARYRTAERQCISRAVSDNPAGPFVDERSEPLVCQLELGGSIDPSPFVDVDGTPYLLWKNDGNFVAGRLGSGCSG